MGLSFEQWSFAGNLGKEPEYQKVGDTGVARFSVAINRTWKNEKGEKKESVAWIRCEAWGKLADLVAGHLKKGSGVLVTAHTRTETWEKDGQKRTGNVAIVESVRFTDPAPKATKPANEPVPAGSAKGGSDEPPF